jgi:CBS domain containing-hemolysin-like protein
MKQIAKRDAETGSLLDGLLRRLRELAGRSEPESSLQDTLEELIEEAEEESQIAFTDEQRALLLNAISFGELRVGDVMVPRGDIKAVPAGVGVGEVVRAMREADRSQLLVHRANLDDVLGIIHVKDLLPFWGDGATFALAEIVRPVLVVPPSMRVLDLLMEMRDKRMNVAVVVDEFGGTDGLVTMGDLVEEIVGELGEEQNRLLGTQLTTRPDGAIDADARVDLEELEKRLGVRLLAEDERDEADTLAGLIFALVDRIPQKGEMVEHPSGVSFEILDADPRRIKRVRIHQGAKPDRASPPGQDHSPK